MARTGVILQLHIETGRASEAADSRRAAGEDAGFFNLIKGFGRTFDDGERGSGSGVALIPVF